jgi:hypothetical protein
MSAVAAAAMGTNLMATIIVRSEAIHCRSTVKHDIKNNVNTVDLHRRTVDRRPGPRDEDATAMTPPPAGRAGDAGREGATGGSGAPTGRKITREAVLAAALAGGDVGKPGLAQAQAQRL